MNDPYQPPRAADYVNAPSSDGEVPAEAVDALRETRPWVTLLAILGFIGAGFMILAGLAIFAIGGNVGRGMPPAFGLVYVLLAVIYLLPSVLLQRYSSSIGRVLDGAGTPAFIEALRSQRSLWRTMGILTLVMIVLMMLAFVGGIGAALMLRPR
jgi:hypothetical protein